MKKLVLVFLLFPFIADAQPFYKQYFQIDTTASQGFDAVCTNSYGEIVTAGRMIDSAGNSNIVFVKFDQAGNLIQSVKWSNPGLAWSPQSITADSTGYWFTGQTFTYFYSIVVRMDNNFNVLWTKHVYDPGDRVISYFCKPDGTGGCVVGGIYYQPTVYSMEEISWAMRMDANGNVIWSKLFTWQNHVFWFRDNDVHFPGQGAVDILYFSNHKDTANPWTSYSHGLMRLDSNGNIQWIRAYNDSTYHMPTRMIRLADSSYVMAGIMDTANGAAIYRNFIMRVDRNGFPIWTRTFAGDIWMVNITHYELVEMDNGNILFTGLNSSGTSAINIQCDTAGQVVSSNAIGMLATTQIIGSVSIPGVGIYLAGTGQTLQSTRALLVGMDPAGVTSCEQYSYSVSATADSFWIETPVLTVTAGPVADSLPDFTIPFFVDKANCPIDGVEENATEVNISVFPNPATGSVHVVWPAAKNASWYVEVYDASGRLVISTDKQSGNSCSVETGSLCDGIYLFRIMSENSLVAVEEIVVTGHD